MLRDLIRNDSEILLFLKTIFKDENVDVYGDKK